MARKRKKDAKARIAVMPVMRPDAAGIDIGRQKRQETKLRAKAEAPGFRLIPVEQVGGVP